MDSAFAGNVCADGGKVRSCGSCGAPAVSPVAVGGSETVSTRGGSVFSSHALSCSRKNPTAFKGVNPIMGKRGLRRGGRGMGSLAVSTGPGSRNDRGPFEGDKASRFPLTQIGLSRCGTSTQPGKALRGREFEVPSNEVRCTDVGGDRNGRSSSQAATLATSAKVDRPTMETMAQGDRFP